MNTIENIGELQTPFYYYDIRILERTIDSIISEAQKYGYELHYAVKANSNAKIFSLIKSRGLGADCVSGNEITHALATGFDPQKIVFAGVGKTDNEIRYAIRNNIACFNCESLQEIIVINAIAREENKNVNIAIRLNPNIDAHTHHYITTGKTENKFGISQIELMQLIKQLPALKNIHLTGLHFHIGSQITDLNVFERLCVAANSFVRWFEMQNIKLQHINLGGGLGIDYQQPKKNMIPSFEQYFSTIHNTLQIDDSIKVHFEPGRSIVGQCGYLYTRVLYTKRAEEKNFVVVDAGLTELIRPALYQSFHKIENISSDVGSIKADVVGPICESSDCFGVDVDLPFTSRGDILKIYSTGAYGESMSSNYNLRTKVASYFSDEISTNIFNQIQSKAS